MLALLLTALLAAPPASAAADPIAIVVARENPGSEKQALAIVERLARRLDSARVTTDAQARERLAEMGEQMPPDCQGRPVCLGRLASKLGARAIVAVEAAELHGTLAVLVEGIGVDASRLCSREFVGKAGGAEELDTELNSFADELLSLLAAQRSQAIVASRPAESEVEAVPAAETSTNSGTSSRRLLGLGLDGAGLALVAGGVGFGLLARRDYDEARAIAGSGDASRAAELDEAKRRTKDRMLLADVLYGAGAIALASGLYFTFTTPAGPLAVAPAPVAAGASLAVTGSF